MPENAQKKSVPEYLFFYLSDFFSALSDETRLKIILSLLEGERTVSDIVSVIGISQSAVSHQLRILRQVGIVKYRRIGRNVLYSLDDEHVRQIITKTIEHLAHRVRTPDSKVFAF
ncbi:transcriptional regulator, ArsR family [Fervidobacterium changbaicum]|uniref:Metalloregulator ArsR/SmtB family transcription factor n=2 Tax=Fervidobacterium TaxID=2422 RepID=A0AAI8CKL7_FERIS|nr:MULTISPECIES: metalloregulator ArsR/SmtB family transcription factor [Fervidobacterium]AMW32313.1 metalloregulator ArsR/SmtB family transcription factor [Fervidobacterium islandicum]QAV32339.1 ArsR family transcriptional regulator [Fervidobacterium changbaicum]SDH21971.1 transcriptional regulator, ArsR family [Fervidobacterium changbaicum]